ncbi:MAG: hypothetical protein Q8L47_04930 [bacterium]|nr:hypothetical protein [bacterium]
MAYSNIGRKFILWRIMYRNDAYIDHIGRTHRGNIVLEQISVTIIEEKEVKGVTSSNVYKGLRAMQENCEVFTLNWLSYPDHSGTPTYYWDSIRRKGDSELWFPIDACQAFNLNIVPHVTPHNTKAFPIGAWFCQKHDFAYIKPDKCSKC